VFLTNRPNPSYFYYGEPVVVSINSKVLSFGSICRVQIAVSDPNQDNSTAEKTAIDGLFYFSINQINSDFNLEFERENGATIDDIDFIKRCSKYKPYTLIFLNAYGAWDSFTFVNGNILTENEKKRFEQMEWRLNGFNMVNKNGKVKYEGMRTYGGDFKTKMKLTTDLLSTEEYKWLFELIVSPLVYLWDKDSSLLHPVQITDTNYEMKNSLQNKSEFLEVNIDVYKQNTQYR
jgi:hypothetical protein